MKHNRVIRNMGWLIGGRFVTMILQFLVSLATSRYLGPTNFGTINYVAAYITFFFSVTSLGLSVVVIKEIAEGNFDSNQLIWTSVWLRFITAVISVFVILFILWTVHSGDAYIIRIALLQSPYLLFGAFDTVNYYFIAKLQSKWQSIAGVLSFAAMSLYRIVLLIHQAETIWFAFATSVDMIVLTSLLVFFYTRQEGFRPRFYWRTGKMLLKQSYHYLIAGLITTFYAQIDHVMLGNMVSAESVGLYSAALAVATLWGVIPNALIHSTSAKLYEYAARDRALFMRRMKQMYCVLFWMNAAYALFVTVFSRWILLFLYGEEYSGALQALCIVAWYYGLSTMTNLSQIYLANRKIGQYINKFCVAGMIINLFCNLMWIPRFGINGAAAATLLTQVVIQFVMPFVYRETRELGQIALEGIMIRNVLNQYERNAIIEHMKKLFH